MLPALLALVVFLIAVEVVGDIVFRDGVAVIAGINVSDLHFCFCCLIGFVGEFMLTDLVLSAGRTELVSASFVDSFGFLGTVDTDLLFRLVGLD